MTKALVTAQWVQENLSHIKIVEATLEGYGPPGREHLPGSVEFNIDVIKDHADPLPHMLPSLKEFEEAVGKLGITADDTVVVYDQQGMFVAPRVWWMFRVFGHKRVFVLNGGLPEWRRLNFPLGLSFYDPTPMTYKGRFHANLVKSYEDMKKLSEQSDTQIIDARARNRFLDLLGIKNHIPNSQNLPYADLLDEDQKIQIDRVRGTDVDLNAPIVTTCGSGVTACILALAFHELGRLDVPVYDGSWTEWSARR